MKMCFMAGAIVAKGCAALGYPVAMRLLGAICLTAAGLLQASDVGRAPLVFREDWTASPPSIPLTQRDVANPDLSVAVHGPGPPLVKKSFHDAREWDPHYVWSGLSQTAWAVSLSLKDGGLLDLTGTATLRWRTRQSGFRALRAVVGLADGSWLVSEHSDPASDQWRVSELGFTSTRWRRLDIRTVTEGPWEPEPNLKQVRSVGFSDLMPGGRSQACSRIDWIEVYGQRVPTGPMQVFLLSGQSNMVGWGNSLELDSVSRFGHDGRLAMFENGTWIPLRPFRAPSARQRDGWNITEYTFGPEIAFARAVSRAWPGRRIGIVKQAVGGTGIMAWASRWNRQDADITGDASKGPLYQELLSKAKAALAAGDAQLRAFIWLQGGKDMRDLRASGRYAENLDRLVNALREDLDHPGLPALVGTYRAGQLPDSLEGIQQDQVPVAQGRPGAYDVLVAQTNVGKRIANAAAVVLRDLPRHEGNIHANTDGMVQAGEAFARVFLERFASER